MHSTAGATVMTATSGMSMGGGPDAAAMSAAADHQFADLLDLRDVRMVFQPLVDLRTGAVVGLEALVRGPDGSPFASPRALFAAARQAGRVAELDWVCRAAAFRAVLDADLPPAMSLFVNIVPEAIATECPPDLVQVVARAESVLRVFVEVTDRALATDPSGVLTTVDRARTMGWGIAIDDVGASRAPLAMLPIVGADVVKLDLRRLGATDPVDSFAIITSVLRHVEQTGATLVAEGIETEEDAQWARALGATYGQGYYLGAPGPLGEQYPTPRAPVRLVGAVPADQMPATPFELLRGTARRRMHAGDYQRLVRVLALSPRSVSTWPVYLTSVAHDPHLPPDLTGQVLPDNTLLFVTFGENLPEEPMRGVRGVRLEPDDPLVDERYFIFLSDEALVAILARPTTDGPYDVVVTQDPVLVIDIVRHLLRRIPPRGADNLALPRRDQVSDVLDDAATAPHDPARRHGWHRSGG